MCVKIIKNSLIVLSVATLLISCGKDKAVPSVYKVVETFDVGSDVYVRSLSHDKEQSSVWVGTSVGVLQVDVESLNMKNTYTRDNGLANEYVFAIFTDSKNEKWFGTNGGGVSRFTGDKWQTWFPLHGLADYWVYSFTEQKDGTLWIGTWAGLTKRDPQGKFTNYVNELVNEWVYGLDVDSKDHVWIGTEGGVNMYDGQTWHTWTHKDGLGADNKQGLPPSDNTGLGTRSRHDLSVMTQGAMPTYNPNYVFTLHVATDDSVWAGTWGGGVAKYDGKSWTNYTTDDGLAGNIVYSVTQDRTGAMWFGTDNGLSRFDGKRWMTMRKEDGLLENNVYAVVDDYKGRVWVGTRNGVTLITRQ